MLASHHGEEVIQRHANRRELIPESATARRLVAVLARLLLRFGYQLCYFDLRKSLSLANTSGRNRLKVRITACKSCG